MIVETECGKDTVPHRNHSYNFRFEAGWVQEEQCEVIVENAWKLSMGARSGQVCGAVQNVALDLADWSKNVLGDLEKRIKTQKRC